MALPSEHKWAVVCAVLALAGGIAPAASAQDPGVTYDSDSPSGSQYAIPLDQAREGSGSSGSSSAPKGSATPSRSSSRGTGSSGGGSTSGSGATPPAASTTATTTTTPSTRSRRVRTTPTPTTTTAPSTTTTAPPTTSTAAAAAPVEGGGTPPSGPSSLARATPADSASSGVPGLVVVGGLALAVLAFGLGLGRVVKPTRLASD